MHQPSASRGRQVRHATLPNVLPGTVHILSPPGRPLANLYGALRPTVHVRNWAAAPPPHEVRSGDFVVVDLTNPLPFVEVRSLDLLLRRATLCLIPGDSPISPHWLELASEHGVHVLRGRTGDERVTRLLCLVHGPSGSCIADLVLSAEPALRSLRSLVEAVCFDPWSIRRPRHLAVRCRMSLAAVKRQCVSAGFARVEHCILCIRLLAYKQLVVLEHLPVRTARLLAGFDDPSNMRRHGRRAAGRSPLVARVLEALPVNAQTERLATAYRGSHERRA